MNSVVSRALCGFAVAVSAALAVASTWVPKGTPVTLIFDDAVSSKNAKVGDTVHMHVANAVTVNGRTVLAAGTPVQGVIASVSKRGRFGVNAKMQLTMNPVNGITLVPRTKGAEIGGTRGAEAAGAAAGGALVLGPVGLLGGYFVVGKSVEVKSGDKIETEVSKSVNVR